jgi:hypothetical protein
VPGPLPRVGAGYFQHSCSRAFFQVLPSFVRAVLDLYKITHHVCWVRAVVTKRMSNNHDNNHSKREEQPNVLTVLAAAATVGAIAVGLLGAVGSYFSEQEEPVRAGINSSSSCTRSNRRYRSTSDELDDWLAHNSCPSPETDVECPQALQCKICESRQISHVLGCGHTLCKDCADSLIKTIRRCPFDRDMISRAPQKMYM